VETTRRYPLAKAWADFFHPQRRRAWTRVGELGLFVAAPILVTLVIFAEAVGSNMFAGDFAHGPWVAGGRVLSGLTPYVGIHSPVIRAGAVFDYPALAAVLAVPFSLLPHTLASVLFTGICIAAVIATLRLFEIRDWRVYGAAFFWPPVTSGLGTANLTLLLVLGLAAAWRHRDRPFVAGALVAVVISIKVFVWPVAFWLLATRRYRALAWTLACGAVLNLIAWAVVGFDQIPRYLRLMQAVTRTVDARGYSVMRFVGGNASPVALAIALALAATLIVAAFVLARRDQDSSAFSFCVLASLVACPLVWLHYFALLLLPVALVHRRLSPWWLVPMLIGFPVTRPNAWEALAALVVAAAVTLRTLRPAGSPVGALRPSAPEGPPLASPAEIVLPSTAAFAVP
jgi:alpha-1,2-mannosyltransferase